MIRIVVLGSNMCEVIKSLLDRLSVLFLIVHDVLVNVIKDFEINLELLTFIVEVFWDIFIKQAHVAIISLSIFKVVVDQLGDRFEWQFLLGFFFFVSFLILLQDRVPSLIFI